MRHALVLAAALVVPAAAVAQSPLLVSANAEGECGNARSGGSVVSATGRYVAFESYATNLVPGPIGQDPGDQAVYFRDMLTGETEWVSVQPEGTFSTDCFAESITPDGRYVAFRVLFKGVHVRDRWTQTTTSASVTELGGIPNGFAFGGQLSDDGRFIAFSHPANLEGESNSFDDVFMRDLELGVTEKVSVSSTGMAGNDESWIDSKRSMSADGRYIVFSSLATNLVEAALTDPLQAYLRDRQVGTTTLLNVTPAGTPANGKSGDASISANGRYVAFVSFATDLLPSGPVSQPGQIYVRDLQTDEIELVSQGTLGKLATSAFEHQAAVSDDGRWVAFETQSALNDPFETGPRRVFLRDRVAGLTHEVDVDSTGFPASGHARFGGMSRDGRAISFNHEEPLLPQDTLDDDDVYLYDRFEALPWSDLDQGLAGSLGLPVLAGAGTLGPTTISFIALARLLPGTTVFLIVGFSSVSLPFKGGLLVPTPTYLFPLPTGPGKLLLPVHMRSGVPSGVELIMQAWLADPAGPSGFAASNGLSGITP